MKLSPSEPSHCGELRPRRRKRASSSGVCESRAMATCARMRIVRIDLDPSIRPSKSKDLRPTPNGAAAAVTHRCRGAPPPSRWRHRIGWLSAHDDPGHTYRGFAQIVRGRLDLAWTPQELVAPSRENSSHSTAVTQGRPRVADRRAAAKSPVLRGTPAPANPIPRAHPVRRVRGEDGERGCDDPQRERSRQRGGATGLPQQRIAARRSDDPAWQGPGISHALPARAPVQ